ncbi:50S ribosomal protein L28 [Mycoplasma sp. (ex Biomphalaria glabrata)]|uniref:50S ribosomal protein L28 n=1 Tax=Mycoplasma sp. (ex Biomphalaria glabrata) TaxID=1749074 RepID=UPI00073ACD84|nr:50S ribosomal protein L28 [Mycoplasma sp. (ex Biomphalaria glabrata)]ALV23196.1 50S ribosomal protein L28 [Mycoplasma sp. (ex Biomphalaria glabrata)]
MSRKCDLTGKSFMSGNNRSHAMNATRRKWQANLQTKKLVIDGQTVKIKVSARALKTLNKSKTN